jgi:hypothetical protein
MLCAISKPTGGRPAALLFLAGPRLIIKGRLAAFLFYSVKSRG